MRALTEIRGIGASRVRDILDQGVACVGVRAAAGRRDVISGTATVLDADTFVVAGERIRLIGIDAPENDQHCHVDGRPWPCGEMATAAAEAMVGRSEIACEVFGRDRYERPLAVCRRGEVDLNDLIVREGWALAWYPSSGSVVLGPSYEAAEAEAAVHRRGMWRGQFVEPWEWRRGQR
ncbi:MAG: thermonuclease family protein [Geminicoccaceae bacterium]|nr:MAG: thermonuclease family protein [Geminicoccaceae bacterium]